MHMVSGIRYHGNSIVLWVFFFFLVVLFCVVGLFCLLFCLVLFRFETGIS